MQSQLRRVSGQDFAVASCCSTLQLLWTEACRSHSWLQLLLARFQQGKSPRGVPRLGSVAKRRGGGRLQVERSMQDLLESLEDEALEESEKFVKRAYK